MTNTNTNPTPTTRKRDAVLAAWRDAFDLWERGACASPSNDDLLRYATEITGDVYEPDTATALYDYSCDGAELGDMVDFLLVHHAWTYAANNVPCTPDDLVQWARDLTGRDFPADAADTIDDMDQSGSDLAAMVAWLLTARRPLIDVVRDTFPNAEPLHLGHPDPSTAEIPVGDGVTVVVDDECDHDDAWRVGVYVGDEWTDAGVPSRMLEIDTAEHVVALARDLRDLHPEGTDRGAWAVQWIDDAIADGRIRGYLGSW